MTTSTDTTDHDHATPEDATEQLDALTAQLHAANGAAVDAAEALAAARSARAAAIVDGTQTAAHIEALEEARDDLEVSQDVVAELSRRRRTLEGKAPAVASSHGDDRTVRVRVYGKEGRHACNVRSTGRALHGQEELVIGAEDALSLVAGGYVGVVQDPLPSWWPRSVPASLDGALPRR